MKIYTGIGSRETPERILRIMLNIAKELAKEQYILRSGGAKGADSAFENGCIAGEGLKEIFLPWKGFNDNPSLLSVVVRRDWAWDMAKKYHPAWDRLSIGVKRMMVRNCMQILGFTGDIPTDFVVCWTKDGNASGGTGQAIRIAIDYKIPVYNIFNPKDYSIIQEIIPHQNQL